MERKTIEHLLKRPCFIDSGRRPRSTPILLNYVPSYKSFQNGPTVKDFRQVGVTVSWPGKYQEEIIQAVPLTIRRKIQIPQLVTPPTDPNFVPSIQSSEVGLPVIQFPSLFETTPKASKDMLVQKRTINLGFVLEAFAPQPSEASPPPPPLGFSQGVSVMKKRKRGEDRDDEVGEQQVLPSTESSKAKFLSQKGKNKNGRAFQKAIGHVSHKRKHRSGSKVPWSCEFYIEG